MSSMWYSLRLPSPYSTASCSICCESIVVALAVVYTPKQPKEDVSSPLTTTAPTATTATTAETSTLATPSAPTTIVEVHVRTPTADPPDRVLQVPVTYNSTNDCDLDAEELTGPSRFARRRMDSLIKDITQRTIEILNETFPRDERDGMEANNGANRVLVRLGSQSYSSLSKPHRNLVCYTEKYPVTINQIFDIEHGCDVEDKCLLFISSTIPLVLETADNPLLIQNAIVRGMPKSFFISCSTIWDKDDRGGDRHRGARRGRPPGSPKNSLSTRPPPLRVQVNYNLTNVCGLYAEGVMNNEADNSFKQDLIEATTTIAQGILNETLLQVEDGLMRRKYRSSELEANRANLRASKHHRNLVHLSKYDPVIIDDIFDIESGCDPRKNCFLVTSTVSLVLESGDNHASINDAIVNGMQDRIDDGSFFKALPKDTADCLTNGYPLELDHN